MIPAIRLAQINPTVGDIPGNAARIRAAYAEGKAAGAGLVVLPELCITGYPPEDLVFTPAFRRDAMRAAEELAALTAGDAPAMLVGCVWENPDSKLYNAALLLDDGDIRHIHRKHHLPNEGVFDEKRLFTAGELPEAVLWRGMRLGVLICEDLWQKEAPEHLAAQKPDGILCVNASPFELGKQERREARALEVAALAGCPLYYLNMVGGQDELVFDGGSFAVGADGRVTARMALFKEDSGFGSQGSEFRIQNSELLYRAMTLGLRDYVEKNGFPGVVIGLSGGIDSALTACVCVDALGAGRVHCVMLPSPYTLEMSMEDAALLAGRLGVRYDIVPIAEGMEAAERMLEWLDGVPSAAAFENIQSRLRGLLLMAISNSTGNLLITTGNKSEMATGYATLYGDMCGAFSVLKDVYKTEVFALARWRNTQGGEAVIPERSITRPPSAELHENQLDEDTLPPYELLDKILFHLIEERLSAEETAAKGIDRATAEKVARLLYASEYKRRQSPPGVKLSGTAFGRDRRFPLTNGFML